MAQQLKKKFIGNDQIDGEKLLLEQNQAVKAKDSSGVEQDLIKFGASDEILVNGDEVSLKADLDQEIIDRAAADASTLSSAEAYTDQKIADLVDAAPALLDTLNELAAALGDDPNFVTTVTGLISDVQSNLDQEILDRAADVDAEQSRAEAAESAIADDVSHLVTLSGVAVDSDNLGVFTGAILDDNAETVKSAIQKLSDEIESIGGGGSSTQLELDATQAGAGLDTDGSYIVNGVANYISTSSSLADADNDLDAAIKVVADDLAQEIIDRAADVDAEQSRAEAAEAVLQSDINDVASDLAQEIIDRGAADDLKVDKAGDEMSGTLVINPVSGNALEAGDIHLTKNDAFNLAVIQTASTSSKQLVIQTGDKASGVASPGAGLYSGNTTSANSGYVQVSSGQASTSGNSGTAVLTSGPAPGGTSGAAQVKSGNGLSSSPVQIISGNASSGNSGNILLATGSASGTRGVVNINAPEMSFQSLGKITNLLNGTNAQDAVTKSQLDAHINNASGAHAASAISVSPVGNLAADDVQEALQELQGDIDSLNALQDDYVVLDGSRPMTGNLNMMPSLGVHNKIVGLGDPTDARDAANKQYVDAVAEGLHVHAPAKLLASADLGGTYDNGVSGVGAFLDLSAAPVASIDGVSSFSVGDRIIVAFQNGSNLDAENGIYYIADSADIDGNGDIIKLTRALDFNTPSEMAGGDFIFVQSGSQYASTGWVMSETVATVGTTPVKFVQFSGAGTYSAGDALDLTGTEFSVRVDNTTIVVNANNDLEVAPSVMSDLAGKVNRAGDTMSGALTFDEASFATSSLSSTQLGFISTAGDYFTAVSAVDGFTITYSDPGGDTVSGTEVYDGVVSLNYASNGTTYDGSVVIETSTGIVFQKTDAINQVQGTATLELGQLSFIYDDLNSGIVSNANYNAGSITVQSDDGSGQSLFQVLPNEPVNNAAFDGSAPAPTLDTHLTSKKYVDDQFTAVEDAIDDHVNNLTGAHAASAISVSPAINGQSDVQSALTDHESRIDVLESVVWFKEKFPISNGQTSVTLSHTPETNSMSAWVDRLAIHEGAAEDFTISGTTMTFLNDLVSPGQSQLGNGDTVYVKYQYKV
jgi:hypothetical protein